MHWQDTGFVLSVRRHGENGAVLSLFTRDHGRAAGFVHGGTSRRLRGVLQPGNRVTAAWSGRLAESLGHFSVELAEPLSALLLEDALALAALNAVCAILDTAMAEREAHADIFDATGVLLAALCASPPREWLALYTRWELGLLSSLGFGLDLSRCAVTGAGEGLEYVSPKTGHAVTAAAAGGYAPRLLRLPAYLGGARDYPIREQLADGLALGRHFLEKRLFADRGRGLPQARTMLEERFFAAGGKTADIKNS